MSSHRAVSLFRCGLAFFLAALSDFPLPIAAERLGCHIAAICDTRQALPGLGWNCVVTTAGMVFLQPVVA